MAAMPVVGIDLVEVAEVEASIFKHGDAYLHRIYTESELEYAKRGNHAEMCQRLAARFAAKEAALKVLAPEGHWFDWRLIEVVRSQHGRCSMRLSGDAARCAERQELGPLAVSLSHQGELAAAVVMGFRCHALAAPAAC